MDKRTRLLLGGFSILAGIGLWQYHSGMPKSDDRAMVLCGSIVCVVLGVGAFLKRDEGS